MSDKPRKTPQQKKALSLKRDCRPAYGNNVKAARKAVPARKALEHRTSRHKHNQELSRAGLLEETALDLVESSARHHVYRIGGWTKGSDVPLGIVVVGGLRVRKERVGRKLRSRIARSSGS